MPQFQVGEQPFDRESDGHFVLDADGVPTKQSDMVVPLSITIPKAAMPEGGWPLYQFFHGSGGDSHGLVDLGYSPTSDDVPELGKGPGFVVARHGIAAVSTAMPVNPERLPGAGETEYLNINNLAAFPFTFQQGVLEQRILKCSLTNSPEVWDRASPVSHVSAEAPPFFVIHGDSDTLVPVPEAREFVKALREKAREPLAYAELPGAQHAFEIFPSVRSLHTVNAVHRFLAWLESRWQRD